MVHSLHVALDSQLVDSKEWFSQPDVPHYLVRSVYLDFQLFSYITYLLLLLFAPSYNPLSSTSQHF